MTKNKRHGDIILLAVEKTEGEVIKHNGSFTLGLGTTTGHSHILSVDKISDLEIKKDAEGNIYLELFGEGTLSHEEHKTLKISPGSYKRVQERETDWFANGITRTVLD